MQRSPSSRTTDSAPRPGFILDLPRLFTTATTTRPPHHSFPSAVTALAPAPGAPSAAVPWPAYLMRFEQWPWLTYLRLLITHQTLSNVVISNQSWGFIQHWLFRNPPSACCCFAAALASPSPCLFDCVLCLLELLHAPKAPSEQPQPISGGPSWYARSPLESASSARTLCPNLRLFFAPHSFDLTERSETCRSCFCCVCWTLFAWRGMGPDHCCGHLLMVGQTQESRVTSSSFRL